MRKAPDGLDSAVAAFYGHRITPIRDHFPTPDNPTKWELCNGDDRVVFIGSRGAEMLNYFHIESIKALRKAIDEWFAQRM